MEQSNNIKTDTAKHYKHLRRIEGDTDKTAFGASSMIKSIVIFFVSAMCLSLHAGDTLVIDQPELAGISGFRAYWDQPVVLIEDVATKEANLGLFGSGSVADWSTGQPGAIAFDAVHRSLLASFPGSAKAIVKKLSEGNSIVKVELVLPFKDTEFFPLDYAIHSLATCG